MTSLEVRESIKDFIKRNAKEETIRFELASPEILSIGIEDAGGSVDDDSFETNGWQWDWWSDATCNGRKLQLSGSGYYGNAALSWEDEDGND